MICRPWMAWSWVRSASSASRITCALRREPQSTTRTPSSRGAATTRYLVASACGGLVIHDVVYTRALRPPLEATIGQTMHPSVQELHARAKGKGTEHQIHVRLAKCALIIVTSVAPAGFPTLKRTRRSSCAALSATSLMSETLMGLESLPAFSMQADSWLSAQN